VYVAGGNLAGVEPAIQADHDIRSDQLRLLQHDKTIIHADTSCGLLPRTPGFLIRSDRNVAKKAGNWKTTLQEALLVLANTCVRQSRFVDFTYYSLLGLVKASW
jgi:hypothetical protein